MNSVGTMHRRKGSWVARLGILAALVACVQGTVETDLIQKFIRAYYIPGSGDANTKFSQSVAKVGDISESCTMLPCLRLGMCGRHPPH